MGITQHSLEALLFAARASSIALIDSVKSVASVSQRVSPFSRHVTRDDCNKRERERERGEEKKLEKKRMNCVVISRYRECNGPNYAAEYIIHR